MTSFKLMLFCITILSSISCNANDKKIGHHQEKFIAKHEPDIPTIKVALLLDTSNSMDGLIDQAKSQLWDIVNELSYAKCGKVKPNLQIALYEYGNDKLSAKEGYLRQVLSFSQDLDEISKELFALTTNGGEEYCGQVVKKSVSQLNWGKNIDDLKLIFIAGNEPFDQGKVNYRNAAINAKEKEITINTIFCGNYDQGIASHWKSGALLTDGEYMSIDQNKRTVHIATPYDDEILRLNNILNTNYIAYGQKGRSKKELQIEQDMNASSFGKTNAVKRTVSKSTRLYKNEDWDLVDAFESESLDIEKITKDELPKILQGKSAKEIEYFLVEKKEERTNIQTKIKALDIKREAYLLENKKSNNQNNLENALIVAIKKQAEQKKYTW